MARGNVGSIYLDLGLISEDLSISGEAPNGYYDGENDLGTTTALHDRGLDNKTGSEEERIEWICQGDECKIKQRHNTTNTDASTTDIARDNYDDDLDNESDPPVNINGTEKNSGERTYDTEDINQNGSLDRDISFVRYRIDLSDTTSQFEKLKNGWRKWRIYLDQYDTIVSQTGSDYRTILSEAQYSRLWLGKLNNGVAEAKVQIVQLAVVGNAWEEQTVADFYKTTSSEHSQIAEVNGLEMKVSENVASRDNTYISVSTINNREDSNKYHKSPNTRTERDSDSNAPLKETALVLDYHDMPIRRVVAPSWSKKVSPRSSRPSSCCWPWVSSSPSILSILRMSSSVAMLPMVPPSSCAPLPAAVRRPLRSPATYSHNGNNKSLKIARILTNDIIPAMVGGDDSYQTNTLLLISGI